MPAPTTPAAAGNGTPSTPSALQSSFVRNTFTLSDGKAREFLWSCELSKDKPEMKWPLNEEDDDDQDGDDLDFIDHTLFVRNAVLGVNATMDERCVVQVETKDYAQKAMKVPIASLTLGKIDMCHLDLNFSHEIPVTFRLIEGTGPIFLTGQHLAELPPNPSTEDEEDEDIDTSCTEGDTALDTEEDTDTSVTDKEKPKKRKGSNISNKKSKRGKTDSAASTATEDDDEDEEEEEAEEEAEEEEDDEEEEEEEESMEEEEEEEEVSPKKKTKGGKVTKKQPTAKELKAKMKTTGGKVSPGKKTCSLM